MNKTPFFLPLCVCTEQEKNKDIEVAFGLSSRIEIMQRLFWTRAGRRLCWLRVVKASLLSRPVVLSVRGICWP